MAKINTKCAEIAKDYKIIDHDDLTPCPFCGDNDPKLVKNNGSYKIFCNGFGCEAQYGWCATEEEAVSGWNNRAREL